MTTALAMQRIAIAAIEGLAALDDKKSIAEVVEHALRLAAPHMMPPAKKPRIVGEE